MNKLIIAVCRFFAKIIRRGEDEEFIRTLAEFMKFGIVGVSNTFIGYFINVAVLLALRPLGVSWDYFVGNVVSFLLSVLWSFYWNNNYVFVLGEGKKRTLWKALLKTYISYGFSGLILSNVLSWIWISLLEISKFIAPLLNLIISVPVNFVMNKLWAFKEN